MDYKKEMLDAIKTLDSYGVNRREIERRLDKREFWLDQALSKGGNKQALAALRLLIDTVVKSNIASAVREPLPSYGTNLSPEPSWQDVLRLSLAALLQNDQNHSTDLKQILSNQAQQGQQVAILQSEILSRLSSIQLAISTQKVAQGRVNEKDTVPGKGK